MTDNRVTPYDHAGSVGDDITVDGMTAQEWEASQASGRPNGRNPGYNQTPGYEAGGAAGQYTAPEFEELIDQAISIVAAGRPLPMSSTVKVNKDELLDILDQIREELPEELRRARWLLKEKDEFLQQARMERQEIIEQGRAQVARMIERQEIIRAAEARARQIVAEARADARTLQRRVEDYCDHKLASFEAVLDRTSRTLQQGREKLLGSAAVQEPVEGHQEQQLPPPPQQP